MNGATVTITSAIVVAIVAVLGLILSLRKDGREASAAEEAARDKIRTDAFDDGARSRNDSIALLQSQLRDAWADRDAARVEARAWQDRYLTNRREPPT